MTLKPRWRRLPLFLAAGVGLFLGVGAALPLWTVDAPIVLYSRVPPPDPRGPLWEAVARMACRPFASPAEDRGNFTLAVLLFTLGCLAGFMAFWVWYDWRDRAATMPPPAGQRSEGTP
jgi:hypothetical protein